MEKIKLLLYCTKQMPRLVFTDGKWWLDNSKENTYWEKEQTAPIGYNGRIIAECDFEAEEIKIDSMYYTNTIGEFTLQKRGCLNSNDLFNYLSKDKGYAIHIKNLNIFDTPRELKNYKTKKEFLGGKQVFWKELKKAPQNMMYCYGKNTGEKYILISIHPEWLVKILNGEKTIEVRKKILKEMMQNA